MMTDRLPAWIRVRVPADASDLSVQSLMDTLDLHTVCRSAHCPNRHECFGRGTATLLILGDTCTRHCGFCAVKTGRPGDVDQGEPDRVARAAVELALRHVVVTSVTRDDLVDGGASVFAETIRRIRVRAPRATVEVLTPDFGGDRPALRAVLSAGPDVFNHNLETVRRLHPTVRPDADYDRSLDVLSTAARFRPPVLVKSGLMLGLGETEPERHEAMRDLRSAGCRMLTLGQYLAPSRDHVPVAAFLPPAVFDALADAAREMGFMAVASGPMVRSSYRAGALLQVARAGIPEATGVVS